MAPTMESDPSNITVEGIADYFSHETEKYIKMSKSPICIEWQISTIPDDLFSCESVTAKGRAYTTSDIDYTVKVCELTI